MTTTRFYDDEMFFDDDVTFDDFSFEYDDDVEFFEDDDEMLNEDDNKISDIKNFLNQIIDIATIAGKHGEKINYVTGELIDTDKKLVHVTITFRDEAHYQLVKNDPYFCVQETRGYEFDVNIVAYAVLNETTLRYGVDNSVRYGKYLDSVFTWMGVADCQLYSDLVDDFYKNIKSIAINI